MSEPSNLRSFNVGSTSQTVVQHSTDVASVYRVYWVRDRIITTNSTKDTDINSRWPGAMTRPDNPLRCSSVTAIISHWTSYTLMNEINKQLKVIWFNLALHSTNDSLIHPFKSFPANMRHVYIMTCFGMYSNWCLILSRQIWDVNPLTAGVAYIRVFIFY